MINPKELRIGNIVSDVIGLEPLLTVASVEQVCIPCGDTTFSYPYPPESLAPVPITPEVLTACGFGLQGLSLIGPEGIEAVHVLNMPAPSQPVRITYEFREGEDAKDSQIHFGFGDGQYWTSNHPPKALHELQNLLYALSGREMAINKEALQKAFATA